MREKFLLEMKDIHKTFPGVRALKGVDFRVEKGKVHALMGENGAGKSTLMKILTGIHMKDSEKGEIIFDGNSINPRNPLEAQKIGISTVYQELDLIPHATIAENIFLGREPKKNGFINWKKIEKDAQKIIDEMGIKVNVKSILNTQSMAVQQMVAIARGISINSKILVLDEPTSSLDDNEVEVLFRVIRKLKSEGVAIVYISHKLEETFNICDMVTILRDGQFISEYEVENTTRLELVSDMIGRDASSIIKYKKKYDDSKQLNEVICEAKHIQHKSHTADLNGASISIKKGEVVGLAGLLGSGRTELAETLFGLTEPDSGEIKIGGQPSKLKNPIKAIESSFAFVPEDRRDAGIIPNMSVRENLTLALLPRLNKFGVISSKDEKEIVESFIKKLKIKVSNSEQLIRNLSGGNQQKVILARWLCMNPDLIILDEPSRGIDVGAKAEIETLIQELSREGKSVLMISSELPELVRNCDRVVVMADGKTVGELVGDEISEDNIMNAIAEGHEEVI
ncbi:sugar ABC transporter ATP-binding protein [uncultured Ilyobacter sp.]|uniref:sugar ABC transporter ATP-binding protein n=1 Tax=uncultured Ilyobacter sp. TaxID=544433 RepID=UPI0029C76708|nr:sugar ABC transporter ATP-binding protein [uncultured Ilyobacter sp.]